MPLMMARRMSLCRTLRLGTKHTVSQNSPSLFPEAKHREKRVHPSPSELTNLPRPLHRLPRQERRQTRLSLQHPLRPHLLRRRPVRRTLQVLGRRPGPRQQRLLVQYQAVERDISHLHQPAVRRPEQRRGRRPAQQLQRRAARLHLRQLHRRHQQLQSGRWKLCYRCKFPRNIPDLNCKGCPVADQSVFFFFFFSRAGTTKASPTSSRLKL